MPINFLSTNLKTPVLGQDQHVQLPQLTGLLYQQFLKLLLWPALVYISYIIMYAVVTVGFEREEYTVLEEVENGVEVCIILTGELNGAIIQVISFDIREESAQANTGKSS